MNRISLLVLVFLFFSCNQQQKESGIKLNIEPQGTEVLKLSTLIKSFKFVELKDEENNFLASPDLLKVNEENIYILDTRQALALYSYSLDGNLRYKVSNFGRGPGEFQGPKDFAIDKNNNSLIIYDQAEIKLCFFDLENGKFKYEKRLEFMPANFEKTEGGFVFFNNNFVEKENNYNVIFTDNDLNIINKQIKISANRNGFHYSLPRNFSKSKYLYLSIPFDSFIYQIKNNEVQKKYDIDFGSFNLPLNFFDKNASNLERVNEADKYAHNISNVFENDSFIFFIYKFNGDFNYYYKNKSTSNDEVIHASYSLLKDDIGVGPLTRWPLDLYNNSLIWFQYPSELKEYLQSKERILSKNEWENFEKNNIDLVKFARTIKDNDNPYLIFTELADHEN